MSWQTQLYTKLSGAAGVAALVGTRIYPGFAPQSAARPYIVYARVSGGTVNHAGGALTDENLTLQIDCWADDPDSADAVAAAVRAAINGWTDETLTPPIGSCLLQDQREAQQDPADGSDRYLCGVSMDFSLWIA